MINTELLLKYQVSMTEAVTDFNYCLICIKSYGRAITIEDLTNRQARRLIRERNLDKVSIDEYPQQYGCIYSDGKFKKYMDAHPQVKEKLYKIIDKLDEN